MPVIDGISAPQLKQFLESIAAAPEGAFAGVDPAVLEAAAANLLTNAGADMSALGGAAFIERSVQGRPVVVFSKTTCPFCTKVKGLLDSYIDSSEVSLIELNQRSDMSDLQDVLKEKNGVRSVPQVYIGGQFLGGCDDTFDKHGSGALKELLTAAGAHVKSGVITVEAPKRGGG